MPSHRPQPPRSFWPSMLLGTGLLLIFAFVASLGLVIYDNFKSSPRIAFGKKIGLLRIEGLIDQAMAERVGQTIDLYRRNDATSAVLIRVNSGGGSVSASEELYAKINALNRVKPVVTYLGGAGASGAYYATCGSREIVANPGCLTGSIGVLMQFMQMEGLFQKLGIRYEVIKSGPIKDAGSFSRALTETERALFQGTIDDVYERFLEVILAHRSEEISSVLAKQQKKKPSDISVKEIRKHLMSIADGRILTGRQAKKLGLVDSVGTFDDALRRTALLAGIKGEPRIVEHGQPGFVERLMQSAVRGILKVAATPKISYQMP